MESATGAARRARSGISPPQCLHQSVVLIGLFVVWQGVELNRNMRRGHGGPITCLTGACLPPSRYSARGKLVGISGAADQAVCVWDLETAKAVGKFSGHTARVKCVALHADLGQVASGSI